MLKFRTLVPNICLFFYIGGQINKVFRGRDYRFLMEDYVFRTLRPSYTSCLLKSCGFDTEKPCFKNKTGVVVLEREIQFQSWFKKNKFEPGLMAHTFDLSTQEGEAICCLQVQGQPSLYFQSSHSYRERLCLKYIAHGRHSFSDDWFGSETDKCSGSLAPRFGSSQSSQASGLLKTGLNQGLCSLFTGVTYQTSCISDT